MVARKKASRKRPASKSSAAADNPAANHPPEAEIATELESASAPICPVVGFGASAGGLEAMTEVLHGLPNDLGIAIVFVQHLDPKHPSMLTELLARGTRMPVQQVTSETSIQPDHVYVIAPNTCIGIRGGRLISEQRNAAFHHMPVDFFFRSLAEDQGSKAIGVVLSGNASDGTLGMKAIKDAGGITIAQEPESAKYDGMPRSAIVSGCVDSVLAASGIASELVRLSQHPYMDRIRPAGELPVDDKRAFAEILGLLRTGKGVDFTQYKPGTMHRRTLRRMAIHRVERPDQYARFLKSHPDELDLLFEDILIHVTSFFREPEAFMAITSHVLPALLKGRSPDDPLRIWAPGCATGEEAYSVAICVLEYMRQNGEEISLQVFGTDLSEAALEQARSGVYPPSIETDVSPERLRRFFVPTNGKYQIARAVRDTCIFARQNVTRDPPFSKIDLITCRNLLIYLGQRIQAKVIRLFHYALKSTGCLVLGASENVGEGGGELFAPVDRHNKIYSRKPARAFIYSDLGGYEERHREGSRPAPAFPTPADGDRRIDQLILSQYSPPAVLVDAELKILQFRGDTSPYLQHLPGGASLSLAKLARGNLGSEVRALFHSPEFKAGPVRSKPISIPVDGAEVKFAVSILPVPGMLEPQYLVTFERQPLEGKRQASKRSAPTGRSATLEEGERTSKRN